MPRRKKITVKLKDLEDAKYLERLFGREPLFEEYDLSTLQITVQKKIYHKIKDIDRVIDNIERYLAINPNMVVISEFDGGYWVSRELLAKMAKVTRVTITKWFADKIIAPRREVGFSSPDPYYVLEQLKVIRDMEREESKLIAQKAENQE